MTQSNTSSRRASAPSAIPTTTPFFLIGSVRSGTTLLRLMLGHHPDIASNLEAEYLVSQITDPNNFPDIADYRYWLSKDRVFQHSNLAVDPDLNYVELLNDFMCQKQQRDNASIVGATVHVGFNRLPRIWPNAKYIYLLRDGRDVSRSVMQMGWAGNLWTAADVWLEAEINWEEMHPTLKPSQYIELTYEDLIPHTERELTRICEFLGTQFTRQMFNYAKSTTYGMPDAKLVYQWKRKISAPDLQQVETRVANQLLKRGYELSGLERVPYVKNRDRILRFQSRKKTFEFRRQKFGTWLVVSDMISRRLGCKSWQQKCQAKIDKIVDDNLR